ncbi:MAG: flavodoxin domain-containing protein [Pseudomonadota bacterium]
MTEHDTTLMQRVAETLANPPQSTIPDFIPPDAPFDEEQRTWLSGLFAGLYALSAAAKAGSASPAAGTALTILYGSQSGTCEALSKDLKKYAASQGFDATIAELNTQVANDLGSVQHLLVIAATFGEGEPTDNARSFYDALMAKDASKLPATLNFSVCGMGDSSYPHFNKIGRDLDRRLAELGATRATPMAVCDVAYDDDYAAWRKAVFATETFQAAAGEAQAPVTEEQTAQFDKNTPFMGTVLDVRRLSGAGSAKCVNHIEISLSGGGDDLDYQVGDALGVWPTNDQSEVAAILSETGFHGSEQVSLKSGPTTLRAALLQSLDLITVSPKTTEVWQCESQDDWQLIDLLRSGIEDLTPQGLVDGMRPLQPRLYSISSSPKEHPGEVHLTVGEVHYELHGSSRKGVASNFLGARSGPGSTVGVYLQRSTHFHLTSDDAAPVIMIGPGTGIAPFRAFLEERQARGASGPNWLFFGDQHAATDYLYQNEIEAWLQNGLLDKASLAWSRDTAEKIYVQHLIQRQGAEFIQWLDDGAVIYVCGDASRMAVDVEHSILDLFRVHKHLDEEAAAKHLESLRASHRYQRDVY